jgi:hypothetical protein
MKLLLCYFAATLAMRRSWKVLRRDAHRLIGEAFEDGMRQSSRPGPVDSDGAHMTKPVDKFGHVLRRGRSRSVPEPSDPGDLAAWTWIEQRFKSPEGVSIEAGREHLTGDTLSALSCAADYSFENERRRKEDAATAQFVDKNACKLAGSHGNLR